MPSPNPSRVLRCYDNGGKTADRYTVYFLALPRERDGTVQCRGMSAHPCHPQGFGLWCSGHLGRHNGRRIAFSALPVDCQRLILCDLARDQSPHLSE